PPDPRSIPPPTLQNDRSAPSPAAWYRRADCWPRATLRGSRNRASFRHPLRTAAGAAARGGRDNAAPRRPYRRARAVASRALSASALTLAARPHRREPGAGHPARFVGRVGLGEDLDAARDCGAGRQFLPVEDQPLLQ